MSKNEAYQPGSVGDLAKGKLVTFIASWGITSMLPRKIGKQQAVFGVCQIKETARH